MRSTTNHRLPFSPIADAVRQRFKHGAIKILNTTGPGRDPVVSTSDAKHAIHLAMGDNFNKEKTISVHTQYSPALDYLSTCIVRLRDFITSIKDDIHCKT